MPISFDLSENTRLAREHFRAMAREHMRPISRKYDDQEHDLPTEWVDWYWKHGRAGTPKVDGPSDGFIQICVQTEELCWGDAALYLRLPSPKYPGYREKIWDHAAGVLVVEEAGGRVTDMHGQRLDFASDFKMNDNRGVVVSAGPFHDAVIAALTECQDIST